jgi:hypothetical protein
MAFSEKRGAFASMLLAALSIMAVIAINVLVSVSTI